MKFSSEDAEYYEETLRGLANDQINGRIYSNEYLVWAENEIDELRAALEKKSKEIARLNRQKAEVATGYVKVSVLVQKPGQPEPSAPEGSMFLGEGHVVVQGVCSNCNSSE